MNICGLDIGTMNVCSAKLKKGKAEVNSMRNMFIEVDTNMVSKEELDSAKLDYVSIDVDGQEKCFIVSEDCMKFSQIFGQTPSRPMSQGVISKKEIDAIPIMTAMIENLVGKTDSGYCVFSVPAAAIDNDTLKVLYHEKIFSQILTKLGYTSKAISEGMGVIYSNCVDEQYSGIGVSWGCGMTNISVAYRGIQVFSFSLGRGGDFIDNSVAESTDTPISRVTGLKERKLNLTDPKKEAKNSKERLVLDALGFFYRDLIGYVLKRFIQEFKKRSDITNIDEDIPIIISGGTAMPSGFIDIFKEIFEKTTDFPYSISEIRYAKDPLNAVALGNLTYALGMSKEESSKSTDK